MIETVIKDEAIKPDTERIILFDVFIIIRYKINKCYLFHFDKANIC